jgi:hypothetical protein
VWGRAVHRVAADGISPEQAVDEAIAREAAPERVAGRARRSLARLATITGLRRQVRPLLALLPSSCTSSAWMLATATGSMVSADITFSTSPPCGKNRAPA